MNIKLIEPVPNTLGRITQKYHDGHHAIDIGTANESVKPSVRDFGNNKYGEAVVVEVRRDIGFVMLRHDDMVIDGKKLHTVYGHMKDIRVKVGQKVYKNNVLGISWDVGNAFGKHLHFETKKGNGVADKYFMNPVNLLKGNNTVGADYKLTKRGDDLYMTNITGVHSGTCFISRPGAKFELYINSTTNKKDRLLVKEMDMTVYTVDWAYKVKKFDNRPISDPCEIYKKEIATLKKDNASLRSKVAELNTAVSTLTNKVKSQTTALEAQKSINDKQGEEIKQKNTQIDLASKKIQELKAENKELKKKLDDCEGESTNLFDKLINFIKKLWKK